MAGDAERLTALGEAVGKLPGWQLMALCLLMLALIGAADAATKDAALTLPYLIPVGLAAWRLGPRRAASSRC
jgi:hypothetical protein